MTRLKGGKSGFSATWFYLLLILIVVIFISIIFMKQTKEGFKNTNNKPVLTYYFMENCKYCNDFKPIWNDLKNKVNTVSYNEIDISKTDSSIKSVPTIILNVNGIDKEYKGNRSVTDLQSFIETNIKSN